MTETELKEIERRLDGLPGTVLREQHVRALIAEVRRLRFELDLRNAAVELICCVAGVGGGPAGILDPRETPHT